MKPSTFAISIVIILALAALARLASNENAGGLPGAGTAAVQTTR